MTASAGCRASRRPQRENHYRGRFAPSPTGPLHLGSLCTALAGYLQAKSRGGEWLLRIDDADTPRVAPGAGDAIKRALERFGLCWDGPVAYQSGEFAAYRAALERMDAAGLLYPCTCPRKALSALPRPSPDLPPPYPGTCRRAARPRGQPHALRLAVGGAAVAMEDALQGGRRWELAREFGDFIVFRRDGVFAYHLATALDDAKAGVTEVLRGRDLLDSTPLQVYLQQVLGLPTPGYAHVPVIVDRQGAKLSKQNLAEAVEGRDPSATLLALLRLLRQAPPGELRGAPPGEILAWAAAAWDISRLAGLASVPEPDPAA